MEYYYTRESAVYIHTQRIFRRGEGTLCVAKTLIYSFAEFSLFMFHYQYITQEQLSVGIVCESYQWVLP